MRFKQTTNNKQQATNRANNYRPNSVRSSSALEEKQKKQKRRGRKSGQIKYDCISKEMNQSINQVPGPISDVVNLIKLIKTN